MPTSTKANVPYHNGRRQQQHAKKVLVKKEDGIEINGEACCVPTKLYCIIQVKIVAELSRHYSTVLHEKKEDKFSTRQKLFCFFFRLISKVLKCKLY